MLARFQRLQDTFLLDLSLETPESPLKRFIVPNFDPRHLYHILCVKIFLLHDDYIICVKSVNRALSGLPGRSKFLEDQFFRLCVDPEHEIP